MLKKVFGLIIILFAVSVLFSSTKLDSLFQDLKNKEKKAKTLTSIAEEYSFLNKYSPAEEYYDRAIEQSLKEKNYDLYLYNLYQKFILDIRQYYLDNDILVEDYKKSLNRIEISDSLLAKYNSYIADLYLQLNRPEKGLPFALKSIKYYKSKNKFNNNYYNVAFTLSDIYLQMNELDKAISILLENIQKAESQHKWKFYKNTVMQLANFYMYKQIYDKALEAYYELLSNKNCKLTNLNKAEIYLQLGKIFSDKNGDNAEKYLLKSINFYKKAYNGIVKEMEPYNVLANIYATRKLYNKALDYYYKAFSIANENNDLYSQSIIYNNIGEIFREKGEYDKALQYYDKSLNLYKNQFNDEDLLAILYLNKSLIYFAERKYKKALDEIKKTEKLRGFQISSGTFLDIYKSYSKIYEKLKNYKKSLYYLKKYLDLEKKLNSNERQEKINNLQLKLETQHIEEKLKLLKKDKKIKELKYQQVKLRNRLYTILGVLFLAISLFFAYSFYRSQKINAKIKIMNKKLEELSRKDPLTKLSNRRDVTEKIKYEIVRAQRKGEAITFLMCDLDHFKQINDKYGHDAGDFVLVGFANILRTTLRKQDLIARWGGEEFLIVLPETNGENGFLVAEKIRKRVKASVLTYHNSEIKISVTIGVSEYEEGMPMETIIKRADMALYIGKSKGRNQTVKIF